MGACNGDGASRYPSGVGQTSINWVNYGLNLKL